MIAKIKNTMVRTTVITEDWKMLAPLDALPKSVEEATELEEVEVTEPNEPASFCETYCQ